MGMQLMGCALWMVAAYPVSDTVFTAESQDQLAPDWHCWQSKHSGQHCENWRRNIKAALV